MSARIGLRPDEVVGDAYLARSDHERFEPEVSFRFARSLAHADLAADPRCVDAAFFGMLDQHEAAVDSEVARAILAADWSGSGTDRPWGRAGVRTWCDQILRGSLRFASWTKFVPRLFPVLMSTATWRAIGRDRAAWEATGADPWSPLAGVDLAAATIDDHPIWLLDRPGVAIGEPAHVLPFGAAYVAHCDRPVAVPICGFGNFDVALRSRREDRSTLQVRRVEPMLASSHDNPGDRRVDYEITHTFQIRVNPATGGRFADPFGVRARRETLASVRASLPGSIGEVDEVG